jgi:hypothetical protein
MSERTYQTVRLTAGKHRGPEHGACVMELASMLSGEEFTDRPACVCPVIAAILRHYNDLVAAEPRQDLYRCAADVIGTRASEEVEKARLRASLAAVNELGAARARSLRWRMGTKSPKGMEQLLELASSDQTYFERYARAVARYMVSAGEAGHQRMLLLVDELVAIGPEHEEAPWEQRSAGERSPAHR